MLPILFTTFFVLLLFNIPIAFALGIASALTRAIFLSVR